MGKRGTEVARQASDLVLADDDLRTVVAAAEEVSMLPLFESVMKSLPNQLVVVLEIGDMDGTGSLRSAHG